MLTLKLEVIVLPVSDVNRSKEFYETLGFRLDADFSVAEGYRVVQLTPPGSEASIILGEGVSRAEPGSVDGIHLVVRDIEEARAELVRRGADVSDLFHESSGVFHHAGVEERVPGPAPDRADYGTFATFRDPDGNGWVLQEVETRAPGR